MVDIWKIPPSGLALTKRESHIWRADLDLTIVNVQKLYQTLSMDERIRAKRFRFDLDRKRYIVRRGLVRTILGTYIGVEPDRVQFCYGKHGKPVLTNTFGGESIHFNVSHSAGLALFAFTRGCEIGVDVECIRDIPEMDQIAERFFSKRENAVFLTLPESKKKEAFFCCWTRKEAFIKAIGDGLSRPLEEFDVSLAPGETDKLLSIKKNLGQASLWSVQGLKAALGFAAAFAVEGRDWRLKCWQWSV